MSLELAISKNFSVAEEIVGAEKTPVITIDNWLNNAYSLKEYAPQDSGKWVAPTTLYPGLWTQTPESYVPALMTTLRPMIKKYFGVKKEQPKHIFSCYAIITKSPEELSNYQRIPHFDTLETPQIAVLHYLCGEEYGGTGFYRHRKTGYETITRERWGEYRTVVEQELKELEKSKPCYFDEANSYFEKIAAYRVKFDRLLVYPSQILHTGLVKTPHRDKDSIGSRRLTVTTFISYY